MKNLDIMKLQRTPSNQLLTYLLLFSLSVLCSSSTHNLKRHLEIDDSGGNEKRKSIDDNFSQLDQYLYSSYQEPLPSFGIFDFLSTDTSSNDIQMQSIDDYGWQQQMDLLFPSNFDPTAIFQNEIPGDNVGNHFESSSISPAKSTSPFQLNSFEDEQQALLSFEASDLDHFLQDCDKFLPRKETNKRLPKENQFKLTKEVEDHLNEDELFELINRDRNGEPIISCIPNEIVPNNTSSFQIIDIENALKDDNFVFDFHFGTISWQRIKANSKKFEILTIASKFHFVFTTNELKNDLFFKFSINSQKLFYGIKNVKSKEEMIQLVIKPIVTICQTFSTFKHHSKPFYYIFGRGQNNGRSIRPNNVVPLYFFFTSISHLIQTSASNSTNEKELKQIINLIILKTIGKNHFSTETWKFLHDTLKELQVIDKDHVKSKGYKNCHYDIPTVSFIYIEMKQNLITRQFFKDVWNTCKIVHSNRVGILPICFSPLLEIPKMSEYNLNNFQSASRKLYQILFTDLLFNGNWNSIDELLVRYSKLKDDFEFIATDFRLRIFSKSDFDSLEKRLENIQEQLEKELPVDTLPLKKFIVELEFFIHFKCALYLHDLYNDCEISNYQKVLKTISNIDKFLDRIGNQLSLPRIHLNPIEDEEIRKKIPSFLFISLCKIIEQFEYLLSHSIEYNEDVRVILPEFSVPMKKFNYLEKYLGKLQNSFTRLRLANFIGELDNLLREQQDEEKRREEIEEILYNEKYGKIRDLWIYKPKMDSSTDEDKKEYLNHFKEFLILYNQ